MMQNAICPSGPVSFHPIMINSKWVGVCLSDYRSYNGMVEKLPSAMPNLHYILTQRFFWALSGKYQHGNNYFYLFRLC